MSVFWVALVAAVAALMLLAEVRTRRRRGISGPEGTGGAWVNPRAQGPHACGRSPGICYDIDSGHYGAGLGGGFFRGGHHGGGSNGGSY